jgi:hypothetical protein
LLSNGQYLLGSELLEQLLTKYGVKPDNGRKIIQRASEKGVILSSKPLSFGKGQYLYINPGSYFGLAILKVVSEKYRKPLFRLLKLLDNLGIMSFYEGLKITSSPEGKTASKVSLLVDMISDLEELNVLVMRKDTLGNNFILKRISGEISEGIYEKLMKLHMYSMQLDAMFIPDLLRWMKGLNLINIGFNYRNMNTPAYGVKHNNLFWDAFAYTKTTGINQRRAAEADSKEKQTLVTLDVVLSRKYLQIDLDGYLARLQININSVKLAERNVLPVVIFHEIDELTLNRLKKLGFIALDIKNVYGTHITGVLKQLTSLKTGNLKVEVVDAVDDILSKIDVSGQNEQLRTLRGVLFEVLMQPVLKYFYPNSQIIPGKKLKDPNNSKIREFDLIVISSHPKEILLLELKGYTGKSFISVGNAEEKDTLRYFFRGSIPVAKSFYKDDRSLSEHTIKAGYITTGFYHSNSTEFMKKVSDGSLKPSSLEMFYDGDHLLLMLDKFGFNHESRIIRKYFMVNQKD